MVTSVSAEVNRDAAGRARVERTRLAIFAAGGFTADLQDEATRRSDVVLVDLERLYAGD